MRIKRFPLAVSVCVISVSAVAVSLGLGPLQAKPADHPVINPHGETNPHVSDLPSSPPMHSKPKREYGPHELVETADGRLIPQVIRDVRGGVFPKCLVCHSELENATVNMGFDLDCVFCHGGNPDSEIKEIAHVQPTRPIIMDKTVAPLDYDLPYQKFVNPSNLRVVMDTCGACHPFRAENIFKSMMATAAGHYAGGLYLNGVQKTKTPIYGTFAVEDNDGVVPYEKGAVQSLADLIEYDPSGDPYSNATHFAAVPGQACARCHLWSRGKGYRGAIGAEGTYRSEGCAACHMPYDNDGLSRSADMTIDHTETGHPRVHIVTKQIETAQCVHCHHRGARIGLNYTGRAQMPPRLPNGPEYPGTTDVKFNGNYHYTVDEVNPVDVHLQRGLDCIDCHTARGIMGDGNIYGHMDQATKIECRMCHGMPGELPTMMDHDGLPLNNTYFEAGEAKLETKVNGTIHTIPLVKDIVDPSSPKFNPTAACAMNENHLKDVGGLECYACHSAWTPNCFGCHFERDEQFNGQNLVTRNIELGRVKTNNKVFESFRPFFMGPNSEGRVAPYLVSCQPIADVTGPDGEKILDFQMPRTAKGVSGLGMNPVQPHTIQGPGNVRTCAECHRSPASLGMGTGNYSLARNFAYVTTAGGVQVFDRRTDPENPVQVSTLDVADPRGMVSRVDIVEGTADALYVAAGLDGLIGFHVEQGPIADPVVLVDDINAVGIARVANYFYIIDKDVGVKVYDSLEGPRPLSTASTAIDFIGVRPPRYITTIPIPNAKQVLVWGIYLFVSAGNDGMVVVNVADQQNPVIEATMTGINARDVRVYTHYQNGQAFAVRAYVADPDQGVHVYSLLPDIGSPTYLQTLPILGAVGLDSYSAWLKGDETTPSYEHDYLYVAAGASGLYIMDITEPDNIYQTAALTNLGGSVDAVDVASEMAPPGVDDYALLANSVSGLQVVDVTMPTKPVFRGSMSVSGARDVYVEVQQMDRFLNEDGEQLKENSHPFIQNFNRNDVVRILSAEISDCCCPPPAVQAPSTDLNNDGVVNMFDMMMVIRSYNKVDPKVDLNRDGLVDMQDITIMLEAMK